MAGNVNQVIVNGETILDLTNDTVTASDLAKGVTAHDKSGTAITGTVEVGHPTTKSSDVSAEFNETPIPGGSIYKSLSLTGKSTDDVLMRKGTNYTVALESSNLGNATAADVAKGKTFTSTAGLSVTGTMETQGGGTDTSDATATASDIAQGKTAYVNGEKVTGTLSKTNHIANADATVKQIQRTPMVGSSYYEIEMQATGTTAPGSGKHIFDGESVKLSLDVNSSKFGNAAAENVLKGKTFTSSAGLAVAGTHECPTFTTQEKTVTPSANSQTVQPDSGYDGLSQVTVSGDTNLTAGNIKKGVSIFGVIGAYEEAASGGNGNNNCEAYPVDVTNPAVNFKTASGTIKVYGYAYATSSSSWGGSSTTVLAFDGDGYYKSSNWGSPSKKSCTFDVSGGRLTGLPSLNGGTLLVVRGI